MRIRYAKDAVTLTGGITVNLDRIVVEKTSFVAPAVSYIGQIYPNAGTLVLNGAFTFMSNGRIDNPAAGVTEYVNTATLDGRRLPVGTYGSAASGAQHQSERFTGTGVLIVMREERTGTLFTLR
ncbi:MAG TPA: hypothetical protein PL176_08195 [Kiritimatiellia bacterium]|jgi:hypothetical protein|nr:hypothetical protein [Kiritimatiellia bacterium]HQL51119.1 hypothetical protein [Kiritimatiellia bacterium]